MILPNVPGLLQDLDGAGQVAQTRQGSSLVDIGLHPDRDAT